MAQLTQSPPVRTRRAPSTLVRKAPAQAKTVVGLDLGDRKSNWCLMSSRRSADQQGEVATEREALTTFLCGLPKRTLVVMEVSTQSPWISRLVAELGHEALVADPRRLGLISGSTRKNDTRDAQMLAKLARADRSLLNPIEHRSEEQQADLAVINARGGLVKARTQLINQVRGTVKPLGHRVPYSSAEAFARKAKEHIPEILAPAVMPLLRAIEELTRLIKDFDKKIAKICEERYPITGLLREVPGVGTITSLRFVLVIQRADRIRRSRQVGALLGLVPRQAQSCGHDPQLSITKAGDRELRRLLVLSANYMLRESSPDTDLKRFGLKLCERGGKNAKKRAKVAMARRLSVLLLHLWKSGEVYEPLYLAKKNEASAVA
jgi:transposase